ncbi:hypothetical protein AKO1_011005 [Acrasis kona]|uniref:Rab-GAP TBC domain-containing protein n=1 Tax=Acrasis kona TaxID=1008807 RepID=A0AAW2YTP2_9EUKA
MSNRGDKPSDFDAFERLPERKEPTIGLRSSVKNISISSPTSPIGSPASPISPPIGVVRVYSNSESIDSLNQRMLQGNDKRFVEWPKLGFPDPEDPDLRRLEYAWKSKQGDKLELEAEKVWQEFLLNSNKVNNRQKQCQQLIRKHGIPSKYRPRVWMEIRGVDKKMKENEGYYDSILDVHKNTPCVSAEQIQLDLHRTFPQHPLFFENPVPTSGRSQMQRILTAYSWRNPHVSYCQSLNYIVGILLLHYSEEQSFWMLVSILEELLPANFYNPQLKGVRVDSRVLDEMLKDRLPKLHQHFFNCHIEVQTFCTGWFMRLFVDIFPLETTMRIWDLLFSEGSKVLFRTILAFLKISENDLLGCSHMGEMLHYLNAAPIRQYDYNILVKTCFSFYSLKRKNLEDARDRCTKIVEAEIRELQIRRDAARQRMMSMNMTIA